MELNEYHTKQIFARVGLPVLKGDIAYTPTQVRRIVEQLALKTVWLKPQVMSPAPIYTSDELRDNYWANSATEAEQKSMLIFGDKVPNRSNPFYTTIQRIYVEESIQTDVFCRLVLRVDFEYRNIAFSIKNSQNQLLTLHIQSQKLSTSEVKKVLSFLYLKKRFSFSSNLI